MADFKAMKVRQNRLKMAGDIPTEPSDNLSAAEIAPAAGPPQLSPQEPSWIDGRVRRATGRTIQMGIKVTPAFRARLDKLANQQKVSLVEILERAIEAYDIEKDR